MATRRVLVLVVLAMFALLMAACNLTGGPEETELTPVPTSTPTLSAQVTGSVPTSVSVTTLPVLTQVGPPTSIAIIPPTAISVIPTATPSTISIVLLSPIPGNVVTSNVQVLGSAIHPNFLQYQLEYGPDPNPGNLWYAIGGPRQFPVLNGVLGIWSTNAIPDGNYQLRLRVYLRDGSNPQTVVNNIRVQNAIPTPVPTATPSIPRPIAAFTQDRTSGEAPLVVRFTNRSTGQISGYNWSFGDGSSSAEISPVHVFRAAGEYEVKLTVVGPGGQSNVSQIITVNTNPPVALYEQSAVSGPSPLTVQFTDRSTGVIDSWRWDFGDGTTSTERSPRKVFTAEGTYNISLRVRGPGGTGRAFSVVTVSNPQVPPPQANFTPTNTGGIAPLSIQYTDTSQGQITSRLWEFGDGTTSTDQNPIHQFVNPGVYTVRLTVNGPGGTATQSGTVTVTRAPQAPEARFTANPTSGDAPLIVTFQNFTTGDVTGYRWDFGDGTPIDQTQAPTHTYTSPGTYRVRLTALGPDGLSDTAEADISVTRPLAPPSADFNVSPQEGSAPLDVQFNNLSSGDDIQSNWDFGDGESLATNEPIVFHTYEENGTYTVILTVVGPGGPASSATRTVTVTDRVQAAFEVVNLTDPPGLGVAFQDRSTGNLTSWNWSFGDGGSSTDQNPSHTFGQAGTYQVRLVVTSQDGVQSEATQSVTVSAPLPPVPEASFEVTVDDLTAQFTNTSTGQIDSTSWNFGDGQTSSNSNPSHTFAAAGTYTVELTVSNAGGSDSFSLPVTVNAPPPAPPTSAFSFSVEDLNVTLTDESTGEGIFSWAWEFGDGSSSNEQNPTHTFAAAGTYRVRLTVTNAGGSDRSGQDVTVTAPLPSAPQSAFTFSPSGLDVDFTDESTGQIDTWQWDFGDGASSTDQNPSHSYAADGTYTVRLTVANAGGSNFSEQQVEVTAPLPNAPVSSFTFSVQDLTASFTDTSTGENITSWFWEFGDGNTSNEQNPTHAYAAPGTYRARLTVENAGGSDRSGQDVTVSAPVPDAPTSAFTFSVNNLDVQFTDLSTGQIDTWQWDFGDGNTSDQQSPAHSYESDGTYTVRLTVANAGGSNSSEQQVTVSAPLPNAPTSVFTFSVNNLDVQFNDQSTGQIDTWQWDFGDGNTSNQQSPSHSYANGGTYIVRLTVANAGGSNFSEQQVAVSAPLPNAPTSAFTFSVNNLDVQFNDQSTGQIDTWQWDFGDGNSSNQQSPSHSYANGGTYIVRLAVANAGGSNFSEQQVAVSAPLPNAPTSAFTFSVNNLDVQFNDQSTGQIDTWQWDFGDGNSSNQQSPSHSYANGGTYLVRLTVANAGGSNFSEQQVAVSAPLPDAPVSSFTFTVQDLSASFTDTSTGEDITSWFWEFGDGNTSTERNPSHMYGAPGTYRARLTVENAGGSDRSGQDVTVTAPLPPAPQSAFKFSANGLNVQFTDLSTGQVDSYFWEFGDGTQAFDRNPAHSYATDGTYTVRLTVSNAGGSTASEQQVSVSTPLPQAPQSVFTFSANGLNVQFTDLSTGQVDSYFWEFGDGTQAFDRNPAHSYATDGTYTVRLTVSNAGGSNASEQQVSVKAPLPQAPQSAFTFSANNLDVQFSDLSTGTIDSWFWEFGDGATATDQNPFHTYPGPGTYRVTLTVANAGGSNQSAQDVTVSTPVPNAPVPDFTFDVNDLTVTFTDATSGDVTDRLWEFGDGATSTETNPTYTYAGYGEFTVRLTASNAGGSNAVEYQVRLQAPEQPPQESIADTSPVEPNVNDLAGRLSSILNGSGNNAASFAVIGDRSIDPSMFLSPFGDGQYELSEAGSSVDGIIQFYLATTLDDISNPFQRVGSAVDSNLRAANFAYDFGDCGDTLIACELDAISPAITIISLGYQDGRDGTSPDDFRSSLNEIVTTTIGRGSIPVLLTPYTRPGDDANIKALAEVIINYGRDNDLPVVNVWRMFNELVEPLNGNNPSVANQGADRLGDNQIARFGENARNYYVLNTLRRVLQAVGQF